MSFTVDLNTDIGKVRLLLHDLDSTKPMFPDDNQIQAFLNMEDGEVKLAAALGMESIAANRVLTMQVVQLLDLKMDGRQTAEGLLKAAKQLRDSASDDWAGFDIAQVADLTQSGYRDYIMKLYQLESV